MRIQKLGNPLYQSKVALANAASNTADITTLNNNIGVVSGNVTTISGNVTTLSGQINTVSGNVNTVSGNVVTLNSLVKVNTSVFTNTDVGFSTTSTTPVAVTGTSFSITKKSGTILLISLQFGIRCSTNTGSFIGVSYSLTGGSPWNSIGNLGYSGPAGNLNTYEANLKLSPSAGTYNFILGLDSDGTASVSLLQFAAFAYEVPV